MSVRNRSRSPVRSYDDEDGELRYLFIGNLPMDWRHFHIKEFLVEKYLTDIDVIEDMDHIFILKDSIGLPNGECLVAFDTVECCQKALKALQGAECRGKKLIVMTDTGKLLPKSGPPRTHTRSGPTNTHPKSGPTYTHSKSGPKPRSTQFREGQIPHKQKQSSQPVENVDYSNETYGLSQQFMDKLNIEPPFTCRVFVKDLTLEVTETKLREVFSLAGHVISAERWQNFGKVMYEHPLEAVQAISMFDGQTLYGSTIRVKFDKFKNSVVMPEGLETVGPGLDVSGNPMRSVHLTYELQQLHRILNPLQQLLQLELAKQQQSNASQNLMPMLSVNTNQPQNNPLLALLQLLQDQYGANNWYAQENPPFNQNIFNNGNVQSQQTPPTSRFDIPPNALALAQNPLANINQMVNAAQNQMASAAQNPMANMNQMANAAQNPMANINQMVNAAQNPMANAAQNPLANMNPMVNMNALANLQNAAYAAQNQQAPQTRFDIPPSGLNITTNKAMTGDASTSGSGTNDWSQYQNKSQMTQNQPSGYNRSNPDDFDVQRLSDLNKSEDNMKSSNMLLFQNLPPSVTSKALVNKMREVGELQFAEMTGQGRAVVRFKDSRDADRCVKLYDRSKVDGQVITVKIF